MLLVHKDSLLDAEPWIAEELFHAFKGAKRVYLDRLKEGKDLTAEDEAVVKLTAVVGHDPFPYGIEANRKTLEAALKFSLDQKVIPQRMSVDEVFAKNTLTSKQRPTTGRSSALAVPVTAASRRGGGQVGH